MPDVIANEWRICGISSVDRSPIFSRFRSSEATQNGRPDISTTARDSAYKPLRVNLVDGRIAYFVQGCMTSSISSYSTDFSQCLLEGLPKGKSAVLCTFSQTIINQRLERILISRVVIVNPEVSIAFQLQGPSSVFCKRIKHLR